MKTALDPFRAPAGTSPSTKAKFTPWPEDPEEPDESPATVVLSVDKFACTVPTVVLRLAILLVLVFTADVSPDTVVFKVAILPLLAVTEDVNPDTVLFRLEILLP